MKPDNEINDHESNVIWVKQFREAAILRHHGEFLGVDEIIDAGMKKYIALMKERDALGPSGRDILIPLLEDADSGVRVVAAAYLLHKREDIALPVLLEIQENCVTEAYWTGTRVLSIHRIGEWKL